MKHICTHLQINVKIGFVPYLHCAQCRVEYSLSEMINFLCSLGWGKILPVVVVFLLSSN